MKFSIVHFEKPSSDDIQTPLKTSLSFSSSNNLRSSSTLSGEKQGRKSPTKKLIMTRRTEILEPLKKLDDLKQIQLSIIQQRLAAAAASAASNSTVHSTVPRKSPTSPPVSTSSSKSPSTLVGGSFSTRSQKLPIPQQQSLSVASIHVPINLIPSQHAITVKASHFPLTTHPNTLNTPVLHHHILQLQHPQYIHHHPHPTNIAQYHASVNQQETFTSNCERRPPSIITSTFKISNVPIMERPQLSTLIHANHNAGSLPIPALNTMRDQNEPLKLISPEYSKQHISKPSKMKENAPKIKRLSISFNELLNDDHKY